MNRNKKKIIIAILPFLFSVFGPSGAAASSADLDQTTIDRLAGLCRLWGAVKFCHPYLGYKNIDWDKALIETLPAVKSASNPDEYKNALGMLLSFLDDKASHIIEANSPAQAPAEYQREKGKSPQDHPYVEITDDGIAVVVATDYEQFSGQSKSLDQTYGSFNKAFSQASKAEKVLLDFRNFSGRPSWFLAYSVNGLLGRLLKEDLTLPPSRFIRHRGYVTQKAMTSVYSSDLCERCGGRMPAMSLPGIKTSRFVILVNSQSQDFSSLWTALQESGLAVVIYEGKTSPPTGGACINVDVPEGFRAQIRTSELLRSDGSPDFQPDLIVATSARETGLEILRGQKVIDKYPVFQPNKGSHSKPFSTAEKSYRDMKSPDWNFRMLSLFRFWNVVNYFFPYKDLMDQSWDDALLEFIPRFSAAEDETAYVMAIAELSARLQDSHVMFNHPALAKILGYYDPPVRVDLVEGSTVITRIDDPELKRKGLTEGDTVLKIDSQLAEKRRDFLARFFSASTPGRLNTFIDLYFLSGDPNSDFNLTFQKKTGEMKTVTLSRSAPINFSRAVPSSLPIYTVLPEGFGYIDLGRLMPNDVDSALEAIKATPGLILDMRGYPTGGASILGQALCKEKAARARFEIIEYEGISGIFRKKEEFQYITPLPEGPFPYNGKIAVLIGNNSISAAEHTCLMLEVVADVTFIGSPTSGANGNVTYTVLPGGIYISFTGMCVQHADGRQLQRLGIQPDIRVESTIEGILAGRDEVLEHAVKFLNKETKSSRIMEEKMGKT